MGNIIDKRCLSDKKILLNYGWTRRVSEVKKCSKDKSINVEGNVLSYVISFLKDKGIYVDQDLSGITCDEDLEINRESIDKLIGICVYNFFSDDQKRHRHNDGNDSDFKSIASRKERRINQSSSSSSSSNVKSSSPIHKRRRNRVIDRGLRVGNGYSSDNVNVKRQQNRKYNRTSTSSSSTKMIVKNDKIDRKVDSNNKEVDKLDDMLKGIVYDVKRRDVEDKNTPESRNSSSSGDSDSDQKSNHRKSSHRNRKGNKTHTNDRFTLSKKFNKRRSKHSKRDRNIRSRLSFESDLDCGIIKARKISDLCSDTLRLGNMFGDLDCMSLTEKHMEECEVYVLAVKSLLFRDFQWKFSEIRGSLSEMTKKLKNMNDSSDRDEHQMDIKIATDKLLNLNRSAKIFGRINIENEFFMKFFIGFIFDNYYSKNDIISERQSRMKNNTSIMKMMTKEYFSITRIGSREDLTKSIEDYQNQDYLDSVAKKTKIAFNNKLKRELTLEEEQSLINMMIIIKISSMAEHSLNNSRKTRNKIQKSVDTKKSNKNGSRESLFNYSSSYPAGNNNNIDNIIGNIENTPVINMYGYLSSQLNNYTCGNLSRNFLSRSNKLIDKYRILCISVDDVFSNNGIKSLVFESNDILKKLISYRMNDIDQKKFDNDDDNDIQDSELMHMVKNINLVPTMRKDIQKTMFLQIVKGLDIEMITKLIETDKSSIVDELSKRGGGGDDIYTISQDNTIYSSIDISVMDVIVNDLIPSNAYTKRDKDLMENLYRYRNSCVEIMRYQKYQNSSALSHIDIISDVNGASSSSTNKSSNVDDDEIISDARLRNANINLEGTILSKKVSDFFGFNLIKIAKSFCRCLEDLFKLRSVLYKYSMKDALIDVATKLVNGSYLSNNLCQHVFDDNNRKSVFVYSGSGNIQLKSNGVINDEDRKSKTNNKFRYTDPSIRSLQNIYKESHPLSSSLLGLLARLDIKKDCVSYVFKGSQIFRNNVFLLSYLIENNIITDGLDVTTKFGNNHSSSSSSNIDGRGGSRKRGYSSSVLYSGRVSSLIDKITILGDIQWYSLIYKDFFSRSGDIKSKVINNGFRTIFKDINVNSVESMTHINIIEKMIVQSNHIFDSNDSRRRKMINKEMETFIGEFSDYGRRNKKKRHRLYPEEYITYSLVNSIHKRSEVFEDYVEKEFYNTSTDTKRLHIYIPGRIADLIYPQSTTRRNKSEKTNDRVNTINTLKNWCMMIFNDEILTPFKKRIGNDKKRCCIELIEDLTKKINKLSISLCGSSNKRDFDSIGGSIYDVLCGNGLDKESLSIRYSTQELMNRSVLIPVDEDLLFRLSIRSGGALAVMRDQLTKLMKDHSNVPNNVDELYSEIVNDFIGNDKKRNALSKMKLILSGDDGNKSSRGNVYRNVVDNGRSMLYELIAMNVQVMTNISDDVNIIWESVCNTFMFGGISSTSNLVSNRKCGESTTNPIDLNQIIKQKIWFLNRVGGGRKTRSDIVSSRILTKSGMNIIDKMSDSIEFLNNGADVYRRGLLTNDWNKNARWNIMKKSTIKENIRMENIRNNEKRRVVSMRSGYTSSTPEYTSKGRQISNNNKFDNAKIMSELKYFIRLEISRYISKLNISSDCGNSIGSTPSSSSSLSSSSSSSILSFESVIDMRKTPLDKSIMLKYLTNKIRDDDVWLDLVISRMDMSKISRPNRKGFDLKKTVKDMLMSKGMKIMEDIKSVFSVSSCCRDGIDLELKGLTKKYNDFARRSSSSSSSTRLHARKNDFYGSSIHKQNQVSSLDIDIFQRLALDLFVNDVNSNEKSGLSCLFMIDGCVNTRIVYDQVVEKRKRKKGVDSNRKATWFNQITRSAKFSKSSISYNVRCSIANFIVFNLRFYPRFNSKVFIHDYNGRSRCETIDFDFSKYSSHDLMSRVGFSRNGKDIIISYNIRLTPNGHVKDYGVYKTEGVYLNLQSSSSSSESSKKNVRCFTLNTENLDMSKKEDLNNARHRHINGIHLRDGIESDGTNEDEDILIPFDWNENICSPKVVNCLSRNFAKKGFSFLNDVRMTSIVPSESTKGVLSMITSTTVNEIPIVFSGHSTRDGILNVPSTCSPIEVKIIPCRLKVSDEIFSKINKETNPIESNDFTNDIVDHVLFSIGREMFNKCNPEYYTDNISFGSDPYDRQYYRNSINTRGEILRDTNDDNKTHIKEKIIQDIFMSRQSKAKIYVDNIKTERHNASKVDTISSFSICMEITGSSMKSILDDWISTFGFWGIESTRILQGLLIPNVSG